MKIVVRRDFIISLQALATSTGRIETGTVNPHSIRFASSRSIVTLYQFTVASHCNNHSFNKFNWTNFTEQMVNWTKSDCTNGQLNKLPLTKIRLPKFHVEHMSSWTNSNITMASWPKFDTIQTAIDPSHNWSKPQWTQAIGVRVVINFYTFPQNQHPFPGYPGGTTLKYLIYGHLPKSNGM